MALHPAWLPESRIDAYHDADVCSHIKQGATTSFLTMHGKADPRVPYEISENFHNKLCEAGIKLRLILIDDAIHGDARFYSDNAKNIAYEFMHDTW